MVDRLNEFMRNMWHIEWCRQFVELCEGKGEFPRKVRESFFDPEEGRPVRQENTGDFKNYLQMYGL
ncbi:MAG: hypothetical protein ACYC0X_19755 [Pirellulaceae bacterium]